MIGSQLVLIRFALKFISAVTVLIVQGGANNFSPEISAVILGSVHFSYLISVFRLLYSFLVSLLQWL